MHIKLLRKKAILKITEETGGFIGSKIADKITKVSKTSPQNLSESAINETKITKKYVFLQKKRQQIICDVI